MRRTPSTFPAAFLRTRVAAVLALAALPALVALPVSALVALPVSARDWQPVERVAPYAVSGETGIALYESIGRNGPRVGAGRTIAHTDFDLLWTRDYRPQADGSCVLAVARPSLTITYTLPEARPAPGGEVGVRWRRFREGLERHERVHGDHVVEMTERIRDFSLGLSAPDDPECRKVRARLQEFLAGMAAWRAEKARAFDADEMSQGGAVHQLILQLVNP